MVGTRIDAGHSPLVWSWARPGQVRGRCGREELLSPQNAKRRCCQAGWSEDAGAWGDLAVGLDQGHRRGGSGWDAEDEDLGGESGDPPGREVDHGEYELAH